MERATVSKLKDNLSAYLRKVRAGQSIVIYDRDIPIARLERIEAVGGTQRLVSLAAHGITRPPVRPLSGRRLEALLAKPLAAKARVADALIADRAEER